jgi:hypothetical protein
MVAVVVALVVVRLVLPVVLVGIILVVLEAVRSALTDQTAVVAVAVTPPQVLVVRARNGMHRMARVAGVVAAEAPSEVVERQVTTGLAQEARTGITPA